MRAFLVTLSVVMVGCSAATAPASVSKHHYFDVVAATGTFSLTGTASGECTGTTETSSVTLRLPQPRSRAFYFYDGTHANVGGGAQLNATYAAPQGTDSCGECTQGPANTTVLFDLSSLEVLGDDPGGADTVTPVFGAMTAAELPMPCGGAYSVDTGWLHGEALSVAAFRSAAFTIEKQGTLSVHGSGLSAFDGTITYAFKLELQASHD